MTEKCPRHTAAHLPVNDSLVFRKAEDPGPGVSFLRFWGYTAYLNKTKAHLSAMLTGNKYFNIHPYEKEEEVYRVIDEILNKK